LIFPNLRYYDFAAFHAQKLSPSTVLEPQDLYLQLLSSGYENNAMIKHNGSEVSSQSTVNYHSNVLLILKPRTGPIYT
jgi:hypothetical protein